jgi:hypothetical protein
LAHRNDGVLDDVFSLGLAPQEQVRLADEGAVVLRVHRHQLVGPLHLCSVLGRPTRAQDDRHMT